MSEQSERDESFSGIDEASNCAIDQMYAECAIYDTAYSREPKAAHRETRLVKHKAAGSEWTATISMISNISTTNLKAQSVPEKF